MTNLALRTEPVHCTGRLETVTMFLNISFTFQNIYILDVVSFVKVKSS